MLRTSQFAALLPTDPALLGHCRRVAALAHLVAHHLFLPTEEKDQLHAACLLHHYDDGGFSPPALDRLLDDVCAGVRATPAVDPLPPAVRAIQNASSTPGAGSEQERRLGEILRLCDALDREIEIQPVERRATQDILTHLADGATEGLWSGQLMDALSVCMAPLPLAGPEVWPIPAFPQAAVKMLNMLQEPSASLRSVVKAAGSDPAAAGAIMQLANSALFGSRTPAATLGDAITRLGFSTAHRVLTAVAMRPVLHSPRLEQLWPHSLQVADLAEQVAANSGVVDPGEAYLAGLLHDVGRIALLAISLYDAARLHGLKELSCPAVYAESLLLRTDHSALGAEIGRIWRLPEATVEAICYHHAPEATRNRMAHVLYIAEYLSGSDEDLPSHLRMECALNSLGMALDGVNQCSVSDVGSWLATT
jgi:putative nucleotidyltransferase with HDIG domain